MSSIPINSRMAACGFALTIAFAFPFVAPAQQNSNTSSRISNDTSNGMLVARGGRGGGARS